MAVRRRVAVLLGLLCAAAGAGALVVRLADGTLTSLDDSTTGSAAVAVGYGLAGAFVARARPRNLVGWVLLAVATGQALSAAAAVTTDRAAPGDLQTAAAWLGSWVWFPAFALLPTVLIAVYPTGRVGPRRRLLVGASLLGAGLVGACLALADDAVDDLVPGLANPLAAPAASAVLGIAGAALLVPSVVVSVVDAGRRLWRAESPEREQLAWLFTTVVLAVGSSYLPLGLASLLLHVLVPVAVAVGVLRHRLLDLQVVVRRTLVMLGLTLVVVAVFAGTTALLGVVVAGDRLPTAVAGALVALGLLPARDLLQRLVDRLVFGDRRDPLRAVASLARDVAEHDDDALLPQVLRTVATAVRSPHVVLVGADGDVLAETGQATRGDALRLPLHVGARSVGELAVAPRTPVDGWSADDRALLDLLARQVAVVVHAAVLNAEVAASREQVVAATADERARLRAELHDGLGPALSGIALGLEAAEASWQRSPERAAQLIARLREETQAAGREVRRLVEGLRPAALDAAELPRALEAFVAGLRDTGAVDIRLDVGDLPALRPGADAAIYRIVTEAVTNVVRHSGATSCAVSLAAGDDGLRLRVDDDGTGLPVQPRDGVGLVSMRRRAAELGGTWEAGPRPGGGTRIDVVLPLAAAVPA